MSLVMTPVVTPNVIDAGVGLTGRRLARARRFDHGRSRPPALFDRSEVLEAIPGGRRGTTMGDDRAGAAARARVGVGGAGVDTGTGAGIGASIGRGSGRDPRRSGDGPDPAPGSGHAGLAGIDGIAGVDGIAGPVGSDHARPAGVRRRAARTAAPVAPAARGLLADASLGLGRACAAGDPADRYAIAHLAALRGAAAVLAARARPTRGRQGSAWTLMTRVAPEFAEWAAFFAAGSAKRQAVQAGLPAGVTAREADDLVRQVALFLSLVGETIGSAVGS